MSFIAPRLNTQEMRSDHDYREVGDYDRGQRQSGIAVEITGDLMLYRADTGTPENASFLGFSRKKTTP